jgi:hypothetical protein
LELWRPDKLPVLKYEALKKELASKDKLLAEKDMVISKLQAPTINERKEILSSAFNSLGLFVDEIKKLEKDSKPKRKSKNQSISNAAILKRNEQRFKKN